MLETLRSYGSDAKVSQLTSEMYYKDNAGRMDAFRIRKEADQLPNAGHLARRAHVKLSREFDMIGRIHADIFFQERYMLNEGGIKVCLVQRCLLSTGRHTGRCKNRANACITVRMQGENITSVSRPRMCRQMDFQQSPSSEYHQSTLPTLLCLLLCN